MRQNSRLVEKTRETRVNSIVRGLLVASTLFLLHGCVSLRGGSRPLVQRPRERSIPVEGAVLSTSSREVGLRCTHSNSLGLELDNSITQYLSQSVSFAGPNPRFGRLCAVAISHTGNILVACENGTIGEMALDDLSLRVLGSVQGLPVWLGQAAASGNVYAVTANNCKYPQHANRQFVTTEYALECVSVKSRTIVWSRRLPSWMSNDEQYTKITVFVDSRDRLWLGAPINWDGAHVGYIALDTSDRFHAITGGGEICGFVDSPDDGADSAAGPWYWTSGVKGFV